MLVRGVALLANGAADGGTRGNAALAHKGLDSLGVKAFEVACLVAAAKVVGVIKEYSAVDAPHVIAIVGIMKGHAPFIRGRWHRPHHHHCGMRRQKRRERMRLYRRRYRLV